MRLTRREIIGFVVGILPFFVFLGYTQTKSINGEIIEHIRLNFASIIGGIAAIAIAFRQREALRFEGAQYTPEQIKQHKYVVIALIGLGLFQLAWFALGALGIL